jgi:hypothetical protein
MLNKKRFGRAVCGFGTCSRGNLELFLEGIEVLITLLRQIRKSSEIVLK